MDMKNDAMEMLEAMGAKNVFGTDGSAAWTNPSFTYMAMTAQAADHAVSEMNKGNL